MLLKQNTTMKNNRVFLSVTYIREHWYEWLCVVVGEGNARPLWYLPVRRCIDRYSYETWIFPLAPFVLLYYIGVNVFWSIWRDLMEFSRLTADKTRSATEEWRQRNDKGDPNLTTNT
jgi:hypothetical protein